jgi:hypothetical protein
VPPFAPIDVHLTKFKGQQRRASSRLRPPVIVGPFVAPAFAATPIKVQLAVRAALAKRIISRQQGYDLHPPTVVDPPFVPPPAVVSGVDDFTPIIPTMM